MQIPTAESRMADIDTRLSRIEGIVDQIVQRLTILIAIFGTSITILMNLPK